MVGISGITNRTAYFASWTNCVKNFAKPLPEARGEYESTGNCVVGPLIAVSYGIEGWEGYAREATNNFARFFHLDVVGTMLVKAASPGEVVRPEVLAEARRLANALLGIPAPDTVQSELLCCAGCSSFLLQITAGGDVLCRIYGLAGELTMEQGKTVIHFAEGQHRRFTAAGMTEHGRLLEGRAR